MLIVFFENLKKEQTQMNNYYCNLKLNQTWKEVLQPANIIILLSNILIFVLMEVLFFWYIASKSVERSIGQKMELFIELDQIEEVRQLYDYLLNTTDVNFILEKAIENEEFRNKYNFELLLTWISPIFIIIIILQIVTIIVLVWKKFKFDSIDFLLLTTVLIAFLSEVIFYFIVVNRTILIGDIEIIKIVLMTVNDDYFKDILEDILKDMLNLNLSTLPPTLQFTLPPTLQFTLPPTPQFT